MPAQRRPSSSGRAGGGLSHNRHLTVMTICRKLVEHHAMREWRNWQTRWT